MTGGWVFCGLIAAGMLDCHYRCSEWILRMVCAGPSLPHIQTRSVCAEIVVRSFQDGRTGRPAPQAP